MGFVRAISLLCAACLLASGGCSGEGREAADAGNVGSAPPGGLGAMRDAPVSRDQMAREAFDRWAPLMAGGAVDEARSLCEAWLGTADLGHHVEAHKCLANVAIATQRENPGQGLSAGGGAPPISRTGVETAMAHYEKALTLQPLDQDAHIGRVDLLVLARRYREANARMDESLAVFQSRAMLEPWFRVLGRFQRAGAAEEGLAYLQVIEKHHPLDHRVASNLGAFYAMTGNDDEAQAQLERAVTLNPDDPYNHWNLARVYDKRGRLADADRHYQQALAVLNPEDLRARCDYAKFLATRVADEARACAFAERGCPELHERNCRGTAETAEAGTPPAA